MEMNLHEEDGDDEGMSREEEEGRVMVLVMGKRRKQMKNKLMKEKDWKI